MSDETKHARDVSNRTSLAISPFHKELEHLINRHSVENGSNTPDFILADYMLRCLKAFEIANHEREKWYGVTHAPGDGK